MFSSVRTSVEPCTRQSGVPPDLSWRRLRTPTANKPPPPRTGSLRTNPQPTVTPLHPAATRTSPGFTVSPPSSPPNAFSWLRRWLFCQRHSASVSVLRVPAWFLMVAEDASPEDVSPSRRTLGQPLSPG